MLPQENFLKRGIRSSLVQSFLIKCDILSGQKYVFLSYFLTCHEFFILAMPDVTKMIQNNFVHSGKVCLNLLEYCISSIPPES